MRILCERASLSAMKFFLRFFRKKKHSNKAAIAFQVLPNPKPVSNLPEWQPEPTTRIERCQTKFNCPIYDDEMYFQYHNLSPLAVPKWSLRKNEDPWM